MDLERDEHNLSRLNNEGTTAFLDTSEPLGEKQRGGEQEVIVLPGKKGLRVEGEGGETNQEKMLIKEVVGEAAADNQHPKKKTGRSTGAGRSGTKREDTKEKNQCLKPCAKRREAWGRVSSASVSH